MVDGGDGESGFVRTLMEAIVLACAVLEELLPGYRFSPRWFVRYKHDAPEHQRGERFRAMGVPKEGEGGECVFVVGLVPASKVVRGRVALFRRPASDDYILRLLKVT